MKKFLFGALALLVAATSVTSCKTDKKGGNEEQKGTDATITVTLNPTSLTLIPGDQERIYATVSSGTGTYTWTSSNESVATVTKAGIVNAINHGEAIITCTEKGGATATCTVTVVSLVETFTSFPLASVELATVTDKTLYEVGDVTYTPEGQTEEVTLTVKGYLAETALNLFSEGAYYANGTGALTAPNRFARIHIPAFIYYIDHTTCPEVLEEGEDYYYGVTKTYSTTTDTVTNGLVATIVDKEAYWTHVNAAIKAWNEGDKETYGDELVLASEEGFKGAFMTIYEDDETYGYVPVSWMPDAIIEKARVNLFTNDVYNYMYYTTGAVQIRPVLGDYGLGVYVEEDAFGELSIKSTELELAADSKVVTLAAPAATEAAPARDGRNDLLKKEQVKFAPANLQLGKKVK